VSSRVGSNFARRACSLALAASLSASCVQLRWEKSRLERPMPEARLNAVAPGDSLGVCLQRLGAPHLVWEQPNGAIAIAYAWSYSSGWGFGVSTPITRAIDASYNFDTLAADTQGLALWFDADWNLVRTQRGYLHDLAKTPARARPNFVPPRATETEPQ